MSSIGPSLPPHLAKRSRDDEGEGLCEVKSDEKRQRVSGPMRQPSSSPQRTAGPSLPPSIKPRSRSRSSSSESDVGPTPPAESKTVRILGPSAPPAPLSERPQNPPSDASDSSDDDFGPAPPPAGADYSSRDEEDLSRLQPSAFDTDPQYAEQAKKVQRDEWMTLPPTQDDLAARMDPTKLRARKFNTGKGASGSASGSASRVWTETPEQKLKRLQNESLGISAPANTTDAMRDSRRAKEEDANARKIREKIENARGRSLVDQHKDKGTGKEKEDDPSKREFDYEKDMGTGMKIGHKQRNDLLKKAKGFGDRFSSGSYL